MTTFLHYIRAINAENMKEWRIEWKYKPDFIRQFFEPYVYLLPYFLYGVALLGGRFSEHLRSITGISDMIAYTFIGYLIMGFLNTACWAMGSSIRKEQWYGTLDTTQAVVISAFFAIAFQTTGLLPALLIIALMLLALYGLGVTVAGLTIGLKQWWVISEALSTLILVVTPIAYPLAVMPLVLRKVTLFLPTTYGVLGVRHFLLGETLHMGLGTIFLRLIIILIIWCTLGLGLFMVMDRLGRRKGILSTY